MENMIIRDFETKDYDRVLELNDESVHFLSPLTKDKLKRIISESEMMKVVEVDKNIEAFVLTFRENKEYDSVNYLWFADNYKEFLYIDRIVVSVKMQGKGLGKALYESVISHAKSTDVPYVSAEIDIKPPNPGSLVFHEKFGFKEVGKQTVAEGKKVVSLQIVKVD